jgi:hypothetical protein
MKQRGRPSPNLVALRPVETLPRLPAPPELSADEAGVFRDVMNSSEGGWFTQANLPLLVQYCRHTIAARRLAELIERAIGQPNTDWGYFASLLTQQRGESALLSTLATKMRLCQQSTRNNRGNAPRVGPAPWDDLKTGGD